MIPISTFVDKLFLKLIMTRLFRITKMMKAFFLIGCGSAESNCDTDTSTDNETKTI